MFISLDFIKYFKFDWKHRLTLQVLFEQCVRLFITIIMAQSLLSRSCQLTQLYDINSIDIDWAIKFSSDTI